MAVRTISLICSFVLLAAACGGTDTSNTEADTAATQGTQAPATTAAPGTTAAPTTVPEATTTTAEEIDPALEAALAGAGTYVGTWSNTTFGSEGPASMTFAVAEDGTVSIDWDLGGFVFGLDDPDAESQTLNVADITDGLTFTTALLGEVTVSVNEDFTSMTTEAPDVPAARIEAFRAIATWNDDGSISGTYEVTFEDGGDPAEGVFELTKA